MQNVTDKDFSELRAELEKAGQFVYFFSFGYGVFEKKKFKLVQFFKY